jgi:outer membrane protein assembly factor BamD (BamD/ComL family)
MHYIFLVLLVLSANISLSQSKKAKKLVNQANDKVLAKDYQGAISDFNKAIELRAWTCQGKSKRLSRGKY